jgi:hypothetical protein
MEDASTNYVDLIPRRTIISNSRTMGQLACLKAKRGGCIMEKQGGLKQPLLGIVGTVIVFFLTFGLLMWFKTENLLTWVAFLTLCAIPIQIIVGLVWGHNYPPPAATLEQPFKGIFLLLFIMLVGAMVASWAIKTVGGSIAPPTPFLILFSIMAVIATLWCVAVWQCWPFSAIHQHPAFIGFGTLVLSYFVAWVLYRSFFDFSFLKGAPFYNAAVDPGGAFNAFVAIGFFATTFATMLAIVEMDFWPLSLIASKAPVFGKQPIWGITVTLCVLLIAYAVRTVFVKGLSMDPVIYFVNVPVCMIFGEFIMLSLMQTAPVQTVKQPAKGIVLVVLSIILAVVMNYLYTWFCKLVTGGLPSGPPGYVFELWLATALLSVTFPVLATYAGFFNFWPLTEARSQK